MSLTFVIPTLNEEGNVFPVFRLVCDVVDNLFDDWEIIFVDDRSEDNTVAEINMLPNSRVKLIESAERNGLGGALSLGWRESCCDYVLFLDCDTRVSIDDLRKIIRCRAISTMVIGSRYVRGSKIDGAPPIKVFVSRILNEIASAIIGVQASDLSHSLRLMPRRYFDVADVLTHPGYFWIQISLAVKYGYRIVEVPITFRERDIGETKNTSMKMLESVVRALRTIVRMRFR